MASVEPIKNKAGKITRYKARVVIEVDEKGRKHFKTMSIRRPEGLTPAKELKEILL